MALFGMKYAFTSMDDIGDEEEAYIESLTNKRKKKLTEDVKSRTFEIDLTDKDKYEKGHAYSYARTGDKVDIDGKKYVITTDENGNHKIGYSDEIYLKDENGEIVKVDKKKFIKDATLLREGAGEFGVWQDVEAKKYDGNLQIGFVAKGLSKEEAEKKAKELKDKYGKYGVATFSVKPVKEGVELVEEPVVKLEPEYDHRKSFYGKARVEEKPDGTKILWSYNTPVAKVENGKATLLRRGYYGWFSSPTTLRHVKEFLRQNGFEIGSKNDLAKMYETEIYESVKEALEDNVSFGVKANLNDKDEVVKAKETIEKEEEDTVERIVDVDADSIDNLKDSYVGNAILQCPVCRTLIYKKPDALVKAEDSDIYNEGEACPHCGSEDGYGLVGQVAELSVEPEIEDDSTTGKEVDLPDIEPEKPEEEEEKIEIDDEDEVEFESLDFDDKSFNRLMEDALTDIYENVKTFETKSVSTDGTNIIVEGEIGFSKGKTRTVSFDFGNKGKNLCESVSKTFVEGDRFSFEYKVHDGSLVVESISYEMPYRVPGEYENEVFRLKGKVSRKA